MINKIILIILILIYFFYNSKKLIENFSLDTNHIHIIGDSHASNKISGWKDCKNIISHHIGAVLCYSFGRDKLKKCDITKFNIKRGDSIIFCFGEIDCRCQINKYITKDKTYKNIINEIVDNYLIAIKLNIKKLNVKLNKIYIYNVVPPVRKKNVSENPEYPFLGSDEDRKKYVLYFNEILKQKCLNNNFGFFNIYEYYTCKDGFLIQKYSDGNVHIKNGIFLQKFINENLI